MTDLSFPVIIISGPVVVPVTGPADLERLLALSTDTAIEHGFYRDAVVVDAGLRAFKIADLRLAKAGLRSWLGRPRKVDVFRLEVVQETVSVNELIDRVTSAIRAEANHAQYDEEVLERISRAQTIHQVVNLLSGGPIGEGG